MKFIGLFFITTLIFFTMDMLWLGFIAKNFYREKLGFIFTGEVNWVAALVFYLIFIIGIIYFAVLPGFTDHEWQKVLINGAFLGFLCYATYDLTNLATIKQWPLIVVVVDIAWGTILTGSVALFSYFVADRFLHF